MAEEFFHGDRAMARRCNSDIFGVDREETGGFISAPHANFRAGRWEFFIAEYRRSDALAGYCTDARGNFLLGEDLALAEEENPSGGSRGDCDSRFDARRRDGGSVAG